MIELRTLGTLDLLDKTDGHQALSVLAQPKRVGFLTYLAVASPRAMHRRDTLLGIFWPDSTDKKARNALNQTVFVLRRALGEDFFSMNGEAGVGINPERLRCDVLEFEAAMGGGEKEEALDLYRGNFLEGFYLPGCIEFERWVDSERGRLRDLATGAVLSLSHEMEAAGNPVGAVGWLRRAREWAVFDELVLCRQVELLLALGDRSGAVRDYEAFARRLSVDLGMEPSPELQRLMDAPPAAENPWRGGSRAGLEIGTPPIQAPGPPRGGRRHFSAAQTVGIAGLSLVLGILGALSVPSLRTGISKSIDSPSLAEGLMDDGVVVIPFENATGVPGLDGLGAAAADRIAQELASTGIMNVWPALYPDDTQAWSGAGSTPGTESLPRSRTGGAEASRAPPKAGYLLTGVYSERNGLLVYQTRVLDAGSGRIAAVVDSVVGSVLAPEESFERLKDRVAGTMAMVLDPRVSYLARIASHPPSFEAYQILADGLDVLDREAGISPPGIRWEMGDTAAAIFLRAAARYPRFTLPLFLTLEATYSDVDSIVQALRPIRDGLPPWERAMLDYHVAGRTFDHDTQHLAMARVVSMSPNPNWRHRLALLAIWTNRPREAVGLLTELEGDRDWLRGNPDYWSDLVNAKALLGDYEGVLRDVYRGQALFDEHVGLLTAEVEALAKLGRVEEARARAVQILETAGPGATPQLCQFLPQALRAAGRHVASRKVAEVAVESLLRSGTGSVFSRATTLVYAGRYPEARQLIGRPEEWRTGQIGAYQLLAYMAAMEGHAEEANRLSEKAATTRDPEGGIRDPNGIMSQVEVAAQLGEYARAMRFLREAYERGLAHGNYVREIWDLTPLYGYKPFEDLMGPKG